MTPLHLCAVDGSSHLVPLLLAYKVDTSLKDNKGRTALHRAVELGKLDVITALLQAGADPNTQDNNCQTPLITTCVNNLVAAVKILCDFGADMNVKNFYGSTCLHSAADIGNLEVFRTLLECCGEKCNVIETVDAFRQTVLHVAARQRNIQFVEELLNRGCSATAKDVTGRLPLHVAARHSGYETVLKLAEVTPDVNTKCSDGKSPLFMACEIGNTPAISALLSKGANIKDTDISFKNTVMAAAIGGFTDIVVDLIKMGVHVDYKDKEGNTALHYACLHGRLTTVKALLDLDACVSDTNFQGHTPLDLAVDKSRSDVAVFFMEHSRWEESLSGKSENGRNILKRMVEKTPAAAKTVLDKCVKCSDHAPTEEGYAIEFNYKYIDPVVDTDMVSDCVIAIMLDNDREELLTHPVCQSFFSNRWHNFVKIAFIIHWLLQTAYLVSVISYVFFMYRPHDKDYRCSGKLSNETIGINVTEPYSRPRFRHQQMHTVQYVLYFFVALHLYKDLHRCYVIGRHSLLTAQFLLSMAISLLVLFAALPPGYEMCDMQWRAISYALLLFFFYTSFLCQRLEVVGLYFTMFFEVIKTMTKISCMMIFFVFAFTIPYGVMLKQDAFQTGTGDISFLGTFSMAVGELNFRENFILSDNSPYNWDVRAVFVVFCIVINFSLMNIMIGVAVGDINRVEKQAYLSRLRRQIWYLLETIKVWRSTFSRNKMVDKLVVYPHSKPKTFTEKMRKMLWQSDQISFLARNGRIPSLTDCEKTMQQEIAIQKASLDTLKATTGEIMDALKKISSTIQKGQTETKQFSLR